MLALSKGPNRVDVLPHHQRMETDAVYEMFSSFLEYQTIGPKTQ
jgi:hypothetical protein